MPLTPDAELSTDQAADVLHVSRPFVIRLFETGQLPHRVVGTDRRVRLGDVTAYKQRIDADRLNALEELTRQAQELGMGY